MCGQIDAFYFTPLVPFCASLVTRLAVPPERKSISYAPVCLLIVTRMTRMEHFHYIIFALYVMKRALIWSHRLQLNLSPAQSRRKCREVNASEARIGSIFFGPKLEMLVWTNCIYRRRANPG